MSQSADVPKPPEDPELRNIIDKLAQFVAKNGSEFENMTKQKQRDNPRFGFLYGGEYFHYYTYRVTVEQVLLRKIKSEPQQVGQQSKIQMLQVQLQESERNLEAHRDVLMKQQDIEINDAISGALEEQIRQVSVELRLNIGELSGLLDSLNFPYAHESPEFQAAAGWIMMHYTSPKHGELLIRYLLQRVKDLREFPLRRLSILYLVGDLIQRNLRERNEHMIALLDRFAPIMTSFTLKYNGQGDDRVRNETEQLIHGWIQQRFFSEMTEWRFKNIEETIGQYQSELKSEYANIVADVAQRMQNQYRQYEMQHHEYARHVQQQMAAEQYQHQQTPPGMMAPHLQQQQPHASGFSESNQQQAAPTPRRSRFDDPGPRPPSMQGPPPPTVVNPTSQPGPGHSPWQQPPPLIAAALTSRVPMPSGAGQPPPGSYNQPPPNMPPGYFPPPNQQQPPPFQHNWPPGGGPPPQRPWLPGPPLGQQASAPFGPALPPPGLCMNVSMSQPPPIGHLPFPPAIDEQGLIPKVAYYDLPAGLMASLVKMEDHDYEPLKPEDLRLPPPMPPSERLMAAVEAFYAPPSHENPRDSDGWERLGLYEYYKEKAKATQQAKGKKNSADGSNSDRNQDVFEKNRRSSHDESDDEEKRRDKNYDDRRSGKERRDTYSDSDSSPRGEREKRKDRKRSASPDSRQHRSRRSDTPASSDDESQSRSSRSRRSDEDSDSGSRSPRRKHSSRHKKRAHKSKREHDRKEKPRSRDRDSSAEENEDEGENFREVQPSQRQDAPNSSNQRVDPFENFRRAQSAGFNQRIRSNFQPQLR